MTDIDSPRLVLRDLLREEWNLTAYTTPFIHTGWHIPAQEGPEISVGPDRETPDAGGTGASAIDASTGMPVQQMNGVAQVHTWADMDEVAADENPKDVAERYADEIKRIVGTYVDISQYAFPADSDVTAANYEHIMYRGRRYAPDDDESPVNHHYAVSVRYAYRNRATPP